MADVSAPTPTFLRGSAVLDYWLVHAEGLTVQPLGARVEEVVVAAPVGHAEALIVRSRMTRRRKAIPAASIMAVEPSAGRLLMDAQTGAGLRTPRLSAERIAAARINAGRGQRFARAHTAGVLRSMWTGSVAALSWLRQQVVHVSKSTARHSKLAGAQTARGVAWLTPRVVAGARTAGSTTARLTLRLAAMVARGVARTARAAASVLRAMWTGSVAALSWLRPRAVHVSKSTAQHTQLAGAQTARGVAWLTPRVVAGARTAGSTTARLTLTLAAIVARGVARTARELERATALAAEHGRASLEARRARRDDEANR